MTTIRDDREAELVALAERVADMPDGGGLLRFSEFREGKREWASVRVGSIDVMKYLCACWNERRAIAEMLRAKATPDAR